MGGEDILLLRFESSKPFQKETTLTVVLRSEHWMAVVFKKC